MSKRERHSESHVPALAYTALGLVVASYADLFYVAQGMLCWKSPLCKLSEINGMWVNVCPSQWIGPMAYSKLRWMHWSKGQARLKTQSKGKADGPQQSAIQVPFTYVRIDSGKLELPLNSAESLSVVSRHPTVLGWKQWRYSLKQGGGGRKNSKEEFFLMLLSVHHRLSAITLKSHLLNRWLHATMQNALVHPHPHHEACTTPISCSCLHGSLTCRVHCT